MANCSVFIRNFPFRVAIKYLQLAGKAAYNFE